MRSSWVTGWALNPVNVFERDGRGEGHAKTEEGTKELGGHKPRTTHSRRHKEGFCLRVLRGDGPPGPGENAALLFEATAFVGFAVAAPGNEGRCVQGHCWVRGRLRHAYEDFYVASMGTQWHCPTPEMGARWEHKVS